MTAMPPVEPGIRPVDPQAEADRLAAERQARGSSFDSTVLSDEVHSCPGADGKAVWVHIRVTTERFLPVPADLGRKLADVVRANWPAA